MRSGYGRYKQVMRWILFAVVLFQVTGVRSETKSPPQPFDLSAWMSVPGFWEFDASGLETRRKGTPLHWVSEQQTELRAGGAPMVYEGLPVVEIVVRMEEGKVGEVFLSFFNRGDEGRILQEEFEKRVEHVDEMITQHAGKASEDLGDALKRPGLRAQSRGWITPEFAARLDTAYSRVREEGRREERPEFINLTIFPPGTTREGMLVQRRAELTSADLAARVQRRDSGEVVIDGVPMVDQGEKGYCAVATMERILRYYGVEVNQHELAQQANSSGESGTSYQQLHEAMKRMSAKIGLRVDERLTFEWKDFSDLLDEYDKAAKRKKLPPVRRVVGGVIDTTRIYASMDPGIFREVRLKRAAPVERFFRDTVEMIDRGIPLAWGVQLGLVEETPRLPQAVGGHMRLIIGYQPQTREIFYTDSWGRGHELKRMSLEDAYTITTWLMVVEPRR